MVQLCLIHVLVVGHPRKNGAKLLILAAALGVQAPPPHQTIRSPPDPDPRKIVACRRICRVKIKMNQFILWTHDDPYEVHVDLYGFLLG